MIKKKAPFPVVFIFLLLLPVLPACTTTTIFDNTNVTQCALQSNLAKDITKSYALQIAGDFLQHVYSDQQFTEKQIELNANGFSVKYAVQENGSGKSYVFLKSAWQDLLNIVAENNSSNFFRRGTIENFKVQFEGIKTIQSAPAEGQFIEIQKDKNILFEKSVTYFKHNRRDIALALLILSGRLSVTDANKSAQQPEEVNSIGQKNYKLLLILILVEAFLLFLNLRVWRQPSAIAFVLRAKKNLIKS